MQMKEAVKQAGRELSQPMRNEGNGGNMDNNGGDDDRLHR